MEARLEAEIEEQQGTIDALSKRCKHYREAYVKEKAKSEHLKTRKREEKQLRKQTEQRIQTELEEKDAIIQEARQLRDRDIAGQAIAGNVGHGMNDPLDPVLGAQLEDRADVDPRWGQQGIAHCAAAPATEGTVTWTRPMFIRSALLTTVAR